MNTPVPPKSGLSTRLRIVFGVSLALNLLVVGLLVGAALRFADADGHRPPPHTLGTAMYRELPQEDRQFLRETSQRRVEHSKEIRLAEAEALATALRASPFDRDALQLVLNAQAKQRDSWQQKSQLAWLERVSQMDAEDRVDYADRLYEAMTTLRGKERRERKK